MLWLGRGGGGEFPPKNLKKKIVYIYIERERERDTNLAFLFNKITFIDSLKNSKLQKNKPNNKITNSKVTKIIKPMGSS